MDVGDFAGLGVAANMIVRSLMSLGVGLLPENNGKCAFSLAQALQKDN
jgi:hypothetical protein